jgi:hypothetical protein
MQDKLQMLGSAAQEEIRETLTEVDTKDTPPDIE